MLIRSAVDEGSYVCSLSLQLSSRVLCGDTKIR